MANKTENMTAIMETDVAVEAAPLSAIDYAVLRAADSYELYKLVQASRSANTLRVYDFHWNKFSWCNRITIWNCVYPSLWWLRNSCSIHSSPKMKMNKTLFESIQLVQVLPRSNLLFMHSVRCS